jgi:hypothetical protein
VKTPKNQSKPEIFMRANPDEAHDRNHKNKKTLQLQNAIQSILIRKACFCENSKEWIGLD